MATPKFKTAGSSVTSPVEHTKRKEVLLKRPDLVIEMVEVSWKSGIDAARNKTKVTAPHWKKGDKVEEENNPDEQKYPTGSQRPGVYLVKSKKGADAFTITVNVIKNSVDETEGKITATLGSLHFEGICHLGVGTIDVPMKIKELPDTLEHYEGDVTWQLETTKRKVTLANKTRLEVFVVFDKPMSFYREGAWAEALRFVFKKAKVGGIKDASSAAAKITT